MSDGWGGRPAERFGRRSEVPVIRPGPDDKRGMELQGFSLGVDEYISKPFSPKTDKLARSLGDSRGECRRGDFGRRNQNHKAAHQVKVDGKEIELSYKEFEPLVYFAENQEIAPVQGKYS